MSAVFQRRIHAELTQLGANTPYLADANEPDPRYRGYGVRAPAMKTLIRSLAGEFRTMSGADRLALAARLIESGYGEQKSVALHLLATNLDHFTPSKFDELESYVRGLHGWSKIDELCGTVLQPLLAQHPDALIERLGQWNRDPDLWLRRASVVTFTRKVARSGAWTDVALGFCDALRHDAEDMVRKGVGWCLKDLMRADRDRLIDYVIELRRDGVSSVVTLYAIRDLKGADRQRVLHAGVPR